MQRNVIALLVLLSTPMSASADVLQGALSAGAHMGGGHVHGEDTKATLGVDIEPELRLGMVVLGGELGLDSYALLDGVPVHASRIAGRAGMAVPLVHPDHHTVGRTVQVNAIGSLELGVHEYSPEGERKEFLGGTTTYDGDSASTRFGGVRAGAEIVIRQPRSSVGVIFKLEMIGRRDFGARDLEYHRVSCGGLFLDDSDCSMSNGAVRVGGNELGVNTSIGFYFGGE
jgi:hypothetical protein